MEQRIVLINAVDGQTYGTNLDLESGNWVEPKSWAHYDCVDDLSKEFFLFCIISDMAELTTLDKQCCVCNGCCNIPPTKRKNVNIIPTSAEQRQCDEI